VEGTKITLTSVTVVRVSLKPTHLVAMIAIPSLRRMRKSRVVKLSRKRDGVGKMMETLYGGVVRIKAERKRGKKRKMKKI